MNMSDLELKKSTSLLVKQKSLAAFWFHKLSELLNYFNIFFF